jgi:hypothetical protein
LPPAQELPNVGLNPDTPSAVLPQALTGASIGTSMLLPDRTPGESLAAPPVYESARAGLPHRDRMLVAAAAATIPLPRVCRNLVVFLLEEVGKKAGLGTKRVQGRP